MTRFRRVAFAASVAFAAVVFSARSQELGFYARAAASYNALNGALTQSNFVFNNFPDVGVAALFPVSASRAARWGASLAFATYSARNTASSPFSGAAPPTDFRMTVHARYALASLLLRIENIAALSVGFGFPLGGSYSSTVDVFKTGKQLPSETTLSFESGALKQTIEIRLEAILYAFALGAGRAELSLAGGFVLTPVASVVSAFDLSAPINQPGIDPLAGIRSLGVQPLSLALGLSYYFSLR